MLLVAGERGEKEGAGFVQPAEDRGEKDLSYSLQLPNRWCRGWCHTLLRDTHQKDKKQWTQIIAREILTIYRFKF